MLSVEEALQQILEHAGRQPIVETSLEEAYGLVLAEPVKSDLDSPPFSKSMMDGFAVRDANLQSGRAELLLIGELMAGAESDRVVEPGTTIRIMTGAPIPAGAEAVVMVERSRLMGDDKVLLEDSDFQPGQNVMPRGLELSAGQTVLQPGHLLGAAEIGILATVGHVHPKVFSRPSLAALSTGEEIVSPDRKPGPGQIRNSNESTILALAQRSRTQVRSLGIARDTHDDLSAKIAQGLTDDVLILSGGVSAGKLDLVPGVLAEHGVEQIFHKVALKPGKPVWFGKHPSGLVFGLPGNPVSVLCCFELFVRTALRVRQGHPDPLPPEIFAELSSEFHYPTNRLTYHPAKLSPGPRGYRVKPISWLGSADLCALKDADSLLVCPITQQPHPAGSWMKVLPLEQD